jgi:hypothetical protein
MNVSRHKGLSILLIFMNKINRTNKKENVAILEREGSGRR